MKATVYLAAAAGFLCASAVPLTAQTPTDPPPVLRIIREDIKQGKGAAHRNSENAFMLEAAVAKYPANVIGMTSITGTDQAWFLEGHPSIGAIENTLAAFDNPGSKFTQLDELDAEFRTSSRSWIAVYRPDLSFRGTDIMPSLAKNRFMNVTILRVQPGHDADFAELGRMAVDASQKAISDQPVAMYQAVSGLPDGTYFLFEPSASLKAMDSSADRMRAMFTAMGDTAAKRFQKTAGEAIASQESVLFSIDPRMSYVSKEFAAADPEFWNPKPEESKATKARPKAALKPAAK